MRRRNYNDPRFIERIQYYTPTEILSFATAFISRISPQSVFVPYAKGNEIDNIAQLVNHVDYQQDDQFICDLISEKTGIKPSTEEEIKGQKYDIVYSDIPIRVGRKGDPFLTIIEKSLLKLNEKGYAIFAFPSGITQSKTFKRWLVGQIKKGIHVLACIDVHEHAAIPRKRTIEEYRIIVFSRNKEKIFMASLDNEKNTAVIIDNLLSRSESCTADYLGCWFEFGEYEDYSDYKNKKRRAALESKSKKLYSGELMSISSICKDVYHMKSSGFEDNDNAIYVPRTGLSDVIKEEDDFILKGHNYFQVIVDPKVILPRYLAFVLNSSLGNELRARSMRGATIKNLSISAFNQIKVPVPPIELQQEYLKLDDELRKIALETQRLQSRLRDNPAAYKNIAKEAKDINNRGDKFEQWIGTLPYPIATILKRYLVEDQFDKKQEILLFFFEAYAILEATILCAVYSSSTEEEGGISDVSAGYFEKASFGSWVKIDQAISKQYRDYLGDHDGIEKAIDAFHTNDTTAIRAICDKDVCGILQSACYYRNTWKGHSGITSDAVYEEHVQLLDMLLRKLQQRIGDVFEHIQLVRSISLEYKSGVFINKVEVLTGSDSTFKKREIIGEAMEGDQLFIHILDTNEFIQLPPYFILRSSPTSAKNACYFYNRIEGDNTRYVSYHFEGQPEDIEEGTEAFSILKKLLDNNLE